MASSDEKDYGYDDEDHAVEEDDSCYYSDDDQIEEIEEEVDGARKAENFAILTLEEIRKRQNDVIGSVCSVLSIPREVAILILLHHNWNKIKSSEEWFANEEGIREAIGLLSGPVVVSKFSAGQNINSIVCNICFENFDFNPMRAASCGHLFCNICWDSYISTAINDGPGCLTLRCPDPSCSAAVGEDMIIKLVSIENQKKYNYYLIRSYVENSISLKWCPAPDCDYAIEYLSESDNLNVKCDCSNSFCWNCLEENHRPVDCDMVAKWNHKNSSEGNNIEWILANSKPCPKCKKPIEKNQGCMHMTCRAPCRHEFCWLCLNPWKEHHFYACNKYQEDKRKGNFTEEERRRITAKESINKYTHFYERWVANESSRKKSVSDLEELKRRKLQKISRIQQVPIDDIKYIREAWEQIIECRRVVKWSYAYGYYIEEEAKKKFFEFIQGDAEHALEKLHQFAEEDVTQYANAVGPLPHFIELKDKLTKMTIVARDYFDKLVRGLVNGLEDVGSVNETLGVVDFDHLEVGSDCWMCNICTLFNGLDRLECDACLHPRSDTSL